MTIKHILLWLLATGAPCALAGDPSAWPIVYEGKVHPLEAGSIKIEGGEARKFDPPAKKNYLAEIRDGGLKFEFSGAGTFGVAIESPSYSFRQGTTLECRLRLEGTINRIDPPARNSSAVMIQLSEPAGDDPAIWSLGFYTDTDGVNYVVLDGVNSTPPYEIGKDFHTYRVVTKGEFATLFVDGSSIGEVEPRRGVRPFGLRFGNLRGGDHTGIAVLESIRVDPTKARKP